MSLIDELRLVHHLWSSDELGYWFVRRCSYYHRDVKNIADKYEIVLRSGLE